jgi:hypothetical protein
LYAHIVQYPARLTNDTYWRRSQQLYLRGRSRQLIDELAQIAMRRTELRRGLQQHVIGLRRAIETDTTIKVKKKPCLAEMIQDIDISTMAVLDDVEKSVRELLQIVGIQANSPHSCVNVVRSSPGCQSMRRQARSASAGLL